MGQKVSPTGLRVGIINDWDSRWFTSNKENYANLLLEDIKIREFIEKKLFRQISKVEIERIQNVKEQKFDQIKIFIHTHKPAIVLGENGKNIEELIKLISKMTDAKVTIDIVNIKAPDMNAKIVADSIAAQIENRASFRRAQKFAIRNALRSGAKGIKTLCSGRLGGVEMARSEGYSEGNVPLQTLRADIDYALSEADTTYGKLGIKVWIYKGEILPGTPKGGK